MINNIFDTHAHYDDEAFDSDRDELLKKIHKEGVKLIINCGCDEKSSRTALAFAEKYDFMYAAVGIHPENINDDPENELCRIAEAARHKKVVAIGEIGLDYYWDTSKKQTQIEVFKKQLELAGKLDLPVIIHDREAHGDTMELLRQFKPKGVLHCYSGSAEMAKEVLSLGMYIGFGGSLTFKNARKTVEVASIVPLDRILLETDCPYMAPVPMRGKRNQSSYIGFVAEKMAEIKGVTAQQIADAATENGKRLFGIM